ncbi:hypothetical protein GF357_04980 [Candidatus Dojkabacteria bacterium]|nr:hypothetical protein [Candidatus Dojkabacteria bacterium]
MPREKMLDDSERYLQLAFNGDISQARAIIPNLRSTLSNRSQVFIEAGTPFIKRYGAAGIREISRMWSGVVVADLKIVDGARREIALAVSSGARALTALGNSPKETLDLFIKICKSQRLISMIDMLGVAEPLKVLRKMKSPPDIVVLHMGRDEENTKGKTIPYKQVNKIRSKFSCLISAAGGIDLKEARSAIFNGADIVVANIVSSSDPWTGIKSTGDVASVAQDFLDTVR